MEDDAVCDELSWYEVEHICWGVARRIWYDEPTPLECADLVQEALLHLWEKAGTPTGVALSTGYLGAMAQHKMIDLIRRWTHVHRASGTAPAHVSTDAALHITTPDRFATLADELDVAAFVRALPKQARRDMILTMIGYSAVEIAKRRGVTREAVHQNLWQARKRLNAA